MRGHPHVSFPDVNLAIVVLWCLAWGTVALTGLGSLVRAR